jgi:hypothetical protein
MSRKSNGEKEKEEKKKRKRKRKGREKEKEEKKKRKNAIAAKFDWLVWSDDLDKRGKCKMYLRRMYVMLSLSLSLRCRSILYQYQKGKGKKKVIYHMRNIYLVASFEVVKKSPSVDQPSRE